jgi:hypothetical protein
MATINSNPQENVFDTIRMTFAELGRSYDIDHLEQTAESAQTVLFEAEQEFNVPEAIRALNDLMTVFEKALSEAHTGALSDYSATFIGQEFPRITAKIAELKAATEAHARAREAE